MGRHPGRMSQKSTGVQIPVHSPNVQMQGPNSRRLAHTVRGILGCNKAQYFECRNAHTLVSVVPSCTRGPLKGVLHNITYTYNRGSFFSRPKINASLLPRRFPSHAREGAVHNLVFKTSLSYAARASESNQTLSILSFF